MTKEELEKEARINLKRRFGEYFPQLTISYVMGAEPREKRIEELEQENKVLSQNLEDTEIVNKALEKENAELKEELKDLRESIKDYGAGCYENGLRNGKRKLEEQIEKMKCCGNCKFGYKCSLFSTQIHKENGVEYQTQAKWNKEKEKYCTVGYGGKYECWEIKENE